MPKQNEYQGMAALSICESLLLAMNDQKLLSESAIIGILQDAASAHEHAASLDFEPDAHLAVAALINGIISGGNSVRRP
ncbi:hypothetical protein ACT3UM_20520 [Halomonas sp. AOP13-D3-9]